MTTHDNKPAPTDSSSEGGPAANALTASQAIEMLSLGASGRARPVDLVIARLAETKGFKTLTEEAASSMQIDLERVLDDRMGLEELRAVKERAKHRIETVGGDAAATAVYFLAVAAGLAHHDVNLSSRAGDELLEALVDLGEASPAPWRALLRCAALRLADLESAADR